MKETLEELLAGRDLDAAHAERLLRALTDPELPGEVSAALLVALRAKGETAEEIRGLARGMRALARRPAFPADLPAIDIVGTGGDGSGSLNLSTGAALLTAACGRPVIKHGNRSISSKSGSADVLEALGFTLPTDEDAAVQCLATTGFTFLFAPHFHPAMAALARVRRELGVRTVFNLLGPLTNPAEPPFGVIGAFDLDVAALMAESISGLPIRRVFVVHGACGWDEATPVGPFHLFDVTPGAVSESVRDPKDHGYARCTPQDLAGGDAAENARQLRAAFGGEPGAHRDALVLGAALALEASSSITADRAKAEAEAAIDDGRALRLVERLDG